MVEKITLSEIRGQNNLLPANDSFLLFARDYKSYSYDKKVLEGDEQHPRRSTILLQADFSLTDFAKHYSKYR